MPSSLVSLPSFSAVAVKYDYRNKNWTNTPNFKSVPKSNLPINAYEDRQVWINQYSGLGAFQTHTWGTQVDLAPGPVFSGTYIENQFNLAVTASQFEAMAIGVFNDATSDIYKKMSEMKVNLAVMAKEASKTSDLILDSARRVSDAYRAFRKGNLRKVAQILNISRKTAHKSWLEYKYGWMPLLMDVKGAAEFFAQQSLGGRPVRFTVSVKKQGLKSWSLTTPYSPAYGGSSSGTFTETLTGQYECRQKLWLEVTNPNLAHLQQLGVTNPLLFAWEVIPYSFVFDWFISVGDYLQGLSALHGLTIRKALRSNVNTFHYEYDQPSTFVVSGSSSYTNGRRNRTLVSRHYARGPFVIPDPTQVSIQKQIPNSFEKLLTGLALLKGQNRFR